MPKEDCEGMGRAGVGPGSAPPSSRWVLAKCMCRKNLWGLVSLVVQCLLAGRRPRAKRPSLYPAFRELRGGALLTQAQRVKWV